MKYAGIKSILFYKVLGDQKADQIIDRMSHNLDYLNITASRTTDSMECRYTRFKDRGVNITLSRFGETPWGLYVHIRPELLLSESVRDGLYQPDRKSYKIIKETVGAMLKKVGAPSKLNKMKLSSVVLAMDLALSGKKEVARYLHIIRQCFIPRHYHFVPLEGDEGDKADDAANGDAYCLACKTSAFTAYGAKAQKLWGADDETIVGENVLRLELSLRGRPMRRIAKGTWGDHRQVLSQMVTQAGSLLAKRLKNMKLLSGEHRGYNDAVSAAEGVKGAKTRERMKYLLRQTHKTEDLNFAVKLLKHEYDFNNKQVNRVFRKLRKLGISPITLPDDEDGENALPSFGALLDE